MQIRSIAEISKTNLAELRKDWEMGMSVAYAFYSGTALIVIAQTLPEDVWYSKADIPWHVLRYFQTGSCKWAVSHDLSSVSTEETLGYMVNLFPKVKIPPK